jgi:catechol 2,3-dioxygenase-like lactoylglutathione lyase family enzyme
MVPPHRRLTRLILMLRNHIMGDGAEKEHPVPGWLVSRDWITRRGAQPVMLTTSSALKATAMTDPRITKLRYIGLAGPDFATERSFLKDPWGLQETASDGELAYFRAEGSTESFVTRLRGAEKRGMDLIGFAVPSSAAVDAMARKLASDGVTLISEPSRLDSPGGGYGFRCFDADGHALEISSDTTPAEARELRRGESIPAVLSHIVLHTPDIKKTVAFYQDRLGFQVSDWLGDFMCFLRCDNVHHSIAFMPGPPCLNHVAYEMHDLDEMMRGAGRLLKAKIPLKWGPGRHTAGNNTFSYFHDPAGNTLEYTAEVDRVDDNWQATVYAPSFEVTDQWGTSVMSEGPQRMGAPAPDPGLWQAPPV